MSFSLDVNILLYASDTSSQLNQRARDFLQATMQGDEICYLTWLTVMSYLRMATHPRIFMTPLTQSEAEDNVAKLMSSSKILMISEDEGFWKVYHDLTGCMPVRGNLVPDAHLAALLKQHGIVKLYTCDRDFHKFTFLRVMNPLE